MRPHVLGIDDGPFVVGTSVDTPIVGVMTEGPDLVESVAVTRFAVDGADATGFLAEWITSLRLHRALQAVVLGGITIAGLAVIDLAALADAVALPVLSVTRRDPRDHRLERALTAAGLADRLAIVDRTPAAFALPSGISVACAGVTESDAAALVAACTHKAIVPEPLRLAHLIGRALVDGQSRGRV
jgi:endonuclease V-like protein UPF0215 family